MTEQEAIEELRKIAQMRGDGTMPAESVIDIAQAVLTLLGCTDSVEHCYDYFESAGLFRSNEVKMRCCWCGDVIYVKTNLPNPDHGPWHPLDHWEPLPHLPCPKRVALLMESKKAGSQ